MSHINDQELERLLNHEPEGDGIQEATDPSLFYQMGKAKDRACSYFTQEACGLAVSIDDLLRAGKKEEGLKMLQDPKNKGLLSIIPREVRNWFEMTVSNSYRPDGEGMSEQSGRMASIAAAAKKIGSGSKQSGSFAAFFKTKEDSTFATNALRFRTQAEAEAYARNLFSRWLGASEWKVMPHTDKPNYEIVNNELRSIKESSHDIQEDEWGGGFQSSSDGHKEVQAGLKGDFQRERAQKLKLIVQVIRGEITKQKFKKLTGSGFDDLMRNSPYYRNQIKRMSKKALAPVVPATPTMKDSYESNGEDIQEGSRIHPVNMAWLKSLPSAFVAEVQEILKKPDSPARFKALFNAVLKHKVTRSKYLSLGDSIDILGAQFLDVYPHKRTTPTMKDSYESDGEDIQEKVDIDGRTRAYRNTVMRLEQARKFRNGKGTEMQENKFGGLYDDGSGKGAFIPAPVDFNFQEAMRIVERYRSLREKKKTLFGAPKDKMEDLNAAVAMKNGKFSLGEAEMSLKQKEYRKLFAKALKKFGEDSLADMSDAEKKKFFNWLKDNWKG